MQGQAEAGRQAVSVRTHKCRVASKRLGRMPAVKPSTVQPSTLQPTLASMITRAMQCDKLSADALSVLILSCACRWVWPGCINRASQRFRSRTATGVGQHALCAQQACGILPCAWQTCGVLSCFVFSHHLRLQPGVASVHASILQKSVNSTSFYLRHFPQFEGMSYGEVRRCFATALVVGLFCGADNRPRLNPKDTEILAKDDKVVLLSNTSKSRSRRLERTSTVYTSVARSAVMHRL